MDDDGAVLRTVGRQIKLWREAAGLKQSELGKAIGYGEDLVSSVERARRVPQPEFLKNADQALQAGGRIAAMAKDVAGGPLPEEGPGSDPAGGRGRRDRRVHQYRHRRALANGGVHAGVVQPAATALWRRGTRTPRRSPHGQAGAS